MGARLGNVRGTLRWTAERTVYVQTLCFCSACIYHNGYKSNDRENEFANTRSDASYRSADKNDAEANGDTNTKTRPNGDTESNGDTEAKPNAIAKPDSDTETESNAIANT